jgi:hypothetical protein
MKMKGKLNTEKAVDRSQISALIHYNSSQILIKIN